jgi:FkbM family methyltransferase
LVQLIDLPFSTINNSEVYRLTHLRFKNNPRVTVYNFGLGEKEGSFKLYIPEYRGYKFDGLGSLDSNFDDSWFSEGIFFYNKKFLSMHVVDCTIKRLDDLDLDPFFIKIDVEGFELEVLLGGEKTIERSRPIMLVESVVKSGKIMQFVEKFGYKMYRYSKGSFILGEQGTPNSFLMTDDKLELLQNKYPNNR